MITKLKDYFEDMIKDKKGQYKIKDEGGIGNESNKINKISRKQG